MMSSTKKEKKKEKKMMNIYRVGYYSPEESNYEYLVHKNKYNDTELKEFVEFACIKGVKKKITSEIEYYVHSYADIHDEVIEVLCSDYGFEKLNLTADWDVFGWASIFTKKDWEPRDNNLNSLTDKIIENGFSIKHDSFLSNKITGEDKPNPIKEKVSN